METKPLVVNLFNGGWHPGQSERVHELEPDDSWRDKALIASGFSVETIKTYGAPWNPAAKKHGAFRGVDPLRALRVLIARRRAALICAHMESAFLLLLLRRTFAFLPPIVIWEVPWSSEWAYRAFVAQRTIPRADGAIVFSKNQIELVHLMYGKKVRCDFVPFYVDVTFFSPRPSHTMNPFILSTGHDTGRDFNILLEISNTIPRLFKLKTSILSAVQNREAFPNVEFIEDYLPYSAFRNLYRDAEIVIITTFETPNACGVTSLMESMAMGKPTIVSDNPALRDYLPPEDSGVVVPVGDIDALRNAIIDLLMNPDKAKMMGKNARAFAERRFNPNSNLKVVTDLFWEVAEKAGTATRPQ